MCLATETKKKRYYDWVFCGQAAFPLIGIEAAVLSADSGDFICVVEFPQRMLSIPLKQFGQTQFECSEVLTETFRLRDEGHGCAVAGN